MYHTPPEVPPPNPAPPPLSQRSGDFSQYQLAGLLQRNKLNVRLEGVEREMSNRSAGNAPGVELYNQGEGHSVETRRLLSEDSTHYILIKGPKKTDNSERVPDIQPAASPWLGGPLSGRIRTGGRQRPDPLWRPISEEESLEEGPSSSSKHPQDTNPSLGDTAPTSPRTLKAIQAAMDSSFSDEEEEDSSWGRGGRRADEEEEDSSWGRGGRRAEEEDSSWGRGGRRAEEEEEDSSWGRGGRRAEEEEEDSSWGRGGRRAEEEDSSWGRGGRRPEEEDSSWGRGGRRAEEEGAGGSVSPRTLLAIQRAMGEELEVGPSQYATMIGNSPVKPHSPSHQHPANRLVVISSSQEETEGKDTPLRTTLTNEDRLEVEKGDEQQSPLPLSLPIPPADRVLLGREEQDETATRRNREEVEEILRRNREELEQAIDNRNREELEQAIDNRNREELEQAIDNRNREELEQAIDNRNRAFHSAVSQGDSLGQDLCVIPSSGLNREKNTGRRSLLTGPLPPSQEERNGQDTGRRSLLTGPLPPSQEERNGQDTGRRSLLTGPLPPSQEERNGQDTGRRSLLTGPLPPSQEERNGQNTGRRSLLTGPLPPSQEERNGQDTGRRSLLTGPLPPSQEERNGQIVKMEDGEEDSDSESFIDVSEGEELKEKEETDDSPIEVGGGAPSKAQEDVAKKKKKEEEEEALSSRAIPLEEKEEEEEALSSRAIPLEEKEEEEEPPTETSPALPASASVPLPNEWEDINVVR
uniref:Uncharacterized protein n=1 Tax=Salmo trutta TaxID=8032 RepID=A0A674BUL4_SALTR